MRQIQFQQRHEASWTALEEILDSLESGRNGPKQSPETIRRLPSLYRDVCQHLALAQSRCYSTALIEKLHYLALRAHHQLYKREFRIGKRMLEFMVSDFPVTLRNHHRLFWLAFILFFGPGILFGAITYVNPDMIYVVVDDSSVAQMEYMYNPDADHQPGRQEGMENASRVSMFGFYVYNNTGIGFRTFAGGILAGLGTLFFLVLNGLVIGGIAGYLTGLGYVETFWGFVIGHGAFELVAIVISGMAGLLLGKAIIAPGNMRRIEALKSNARQAVILISGAAGMFFTAALIEAFWSPLPISATIKFIAGTLLWLLVFSYLVFTGRNRDAA